MSSGFKGGSAGLDFMIGAMSTLAEANMSDMVANVGGDELRSNMKAGKSPTGSLWQRRKEDGGLPLKGAADALEVRVLHKYSVAFVIRGRYVFHHKGAQLKPVRQQIPEDSSVPDKLGDAIRLGFITPFYAVTRAGKRGYRHALSKGWTLKNAK